MEKKVRLSNLELLRIIAMYMIVPYHIVYHCINVQLVDGGHIARFQNAYFNNPVFYKKLMILDSINMFGNIGNSIFILISGYFLARPGKIISLVKISKKLIFQLGFATILLTFGSIITHHFIKDYKIELIDIYFFNSTTPWFVGYYYLVILIAAVYLNVFLEKMDRDKYVVFLVVIFTFNQLGWIGSATESLFEGAKTLLAGIFYYSLGGFISKYEPFKKVRVFALVLIIVCTFVLVNISAYNITRANIDRYIAEGANGNFYQTIPGVPNNSVIMALVAIPLFELFTRINIRNIKIINFLGQATFMVYLLHDNVFFYSIWDIKDWITLLYFSPIKFIVKLATCVSCTFGIGVVAYIFYLFVGIIWTKSRGVFIREEEQL